MHSRILPAVLICLACFGAAAHPVLAISPGQVDDFQDGTTQNWFVGGPHPFPPENMPGGPGGDSDRFLLLTAIGNDGPGSRLAVANGLQWAGDYSGAGVARIGMYLRNFSDVDLYIRLLLANPMGGPSTDAAITDASMVPAGSDWTYAEFSVAAEDLIVLLGDVDVLLGNVTELRIFHNPNPLYPPDPVLARLGVDQIQAAGGANPIEESSWGRVKELWRTR